MRSVVLWGLALLCQVAQPLDAVGEETPKVPFQIYGEHALVVEGTLGERSKLRFVLDTASGTVIHQRLARELRVEARSADITVLNRPVRCRSGVASRLAIGPLAVGHLPVWIADLTPLERELGTRIDGLIGMDVLRRRSFTLDFKRRLLIFDAAAALDDWLPFEGPPGLVVVRVRMQGEAVRLVVDTGSPAWVVYRGTPSFAARPQPQRVSSVTTLSGARAAWEAEVAEVRLGRTVLRHQRVLLVEDPQGSTLRFDGLLGVRALRSRRVVFDFEQQRFGWARDDSASPKGGPASIDSGDSVSTGWGPCRETSVWETGWSSRNATSSPATARRTGLSPR